MDNVTDILATQKESLADYYDEVVSFTRRDRERIAEIHATIEDIGVKLSQLDLSNPGQLLRQAFGIGKAK